MLWASTVGWGGAHPVTSAGAGRVGVVEPDVTPAYARLARLVCRTVSVSAGGITVRFLAPCDVYRQTDAWLVQQL